MKTLQMICLVLIIVGAINWGLVGILNFDLVVFLFGAGSLLTRIVYTVICVAAIVYAASLFLEMDMVDEGA